MAVMRRSSASQAWATGLGLGTAALGLVGDLEALVDGLDQLLVRGADQFDVEHAALDLLAYYRVRTLQVLGVGLEQLVGEVAGGLAALAASPMR